MEAGIYSIIGIHTIRNIDLTLIVYMYNEQRNTHFKLLPERTKSLNGISTQR